MHETCKVSLETLYYQFLIIKEKSIDFSFVIYFAK